MPSARTGVMALVAMALLIATFAVVLPGPAGAATVVLASSGIGQLDDFRIPPFQSTAGLDSPGNTDYELNLTATVVIPAGQPTKVDWARVLITKTPGTGGATVCDVSTSGTVTPGASAFMTIQDGEASTVPGYTTPGYFGGGALA